MNPPTCMSELSQNIARRALRRCGSSLVGRYNILRLIGVGGMAAVYSGVHRNGHGVAIKILHERLASDPEIERLFRRESHLANRVGHPGVLPIIDDDVTEDGCVFLVMPLLRGETLRARAERNERRLPVEEVVSLAHSILGTLAAAHTKRIVHRDIKPENVFVTADGQVKVLDFGIGRFFEANEPESATRSGRAIGTPAFMAPEQALGRSREVDGRTDIWALGATMFSLLSGRFVHQAPTPTEVAVLAATRPAPPLREVAPDVCVELQAVIDRALAFKKEERWADADEMDRALLRAALSGLGLSASSLPKMCAPTSDGEGEFDAVPTRVPPLHSADSAIDDPTSARLPSTEHLAVEASRTTNGGLAGPETDRPARARASSSAIVAFAAAGFVMAAGAVFARGRVAAHDSAPRGVEPLASFNAPSALFEESTPPNVTAASSNYRAAVQLWSDGSSWDAAAEFARAATTSPDFAAAHLWCATAANYVDADLRQQYASAVLFRNALNSRQLELLDALAPSMGDPEDLETTVKKLSELVQRHPEDNDLRFVLAARLERLGQIDRGLDVLAPVLASERPLPLAHLLHARLVLADERVEEARASLRSCIATSPTAMDCLYTLTALERNEGRCEGLEPICRSLLARSPDSRLGHDCLGDALFASSRSPATLQASYQGKYDALAESAALPRIRAQDEVYYAVATGNLADAERLAESWQALATDPISRSEAYGYRTVLSLENGHDDRARAIVSEFTAVSTSWSQSDFVDVGSVGLYLHSLVGDLDAPARARLRSHLEQTSLDPSYGPPWRRWFNVYALNASSPEEAREAVARMLPHPFMGPQYRDAESDYVIGRVFALAGSVPDAKRFLARAAHSCSAAATLYGVLATAELAQLSEDQPDEACALYASVVDRAPTSQGRSAKNAKRKLQELHCSSH